MPSTILVRRLDGGTLCVPAPTAGLSVCDLRAAIAAAEGVPPEDQRLVRDGRTLAQGDAMVAGALPPVTLCLRVEGGKGGFGAMLRGKALAAGQKKTTNFDACRDLNGVRLKAVHQQRQIDEWRSKQDAKAAAKRRSGDVAPPPPLSPAPPGNASRAFDLDGYYEANESKRTATAAAVSAGLAAKRTRDMLEDTLKEASTLDGAPAGAPAAGAEHVQEVRKAAKVGQAGPSTSGAAADDARGEGAMPGGFAGAPARAPAAGASVAAAKWSVLDEPSDSDSDSSG